MQPFGQFFFDQIDHDPIGNMDVAENYQCMF